MLAVAGPSYLVVISGSPGPMNMRSRRVVGFRGHRSILFSSGTPPGRPELRARPGAAGRDDPVCDGTRNMH
jgi:hypothetical protein